MLSNFNSSNPIPIILTRNTIFAVIREARVKNFGHYYFSLLLKQEKLAFSKCYDNLTHALAVNVDRVGPGPFFSGL